MEEAQRLGRALMLPIAVLPVAALLLRLGAPDVLDIPFIAKGGGVLFDQLPLLFSIGVAVGLSKDTQGAAGLAGGVGYLVLTAALGSLDKSLNMGVLSGIIMGVAAGEIYNKSYGIKLPDWLGFFGGKRFAPIATGVAAIVLALIFSLVWPPIQGAMSATGAWIIGAGPLGAFVYGVLNRLLIPTGLHHILNNMMWFQFGDFVNATGQLVHGDLHRFFAGDKSAGLYMTGFFPVMMFGLPAACLAMYSTAHAESRKVVAGMLLSVAVTSFVTGITEPIEYLFMFLSPGLYAAHALLTGANMALCHALGVKMGFGFSAGAIDYALNYGLGSKAWMILVIGAGDFALYFLVFFFAIKTLDLKTLGRDPKPQPEFAASVQEAARIATSALPADMAELAKAYLKALGGKENLESIDSCITRLRLLVKEQSRVDEPGLLALGAKAVLRIGDRGLQVVVGTQAENVASAMSALVG
jgi:PTS system N-acetylglucosamine-specific IIC component